MPSKEEEIYQQRLSKLERLRQRGIDPYPPRYNRTHSNTEAVATFGAWEAGRAGDPPWVRLAGRVTAMRRMGKAAFLDLRDGSGRIQVSARLDNLGAEGFETLKDLDLGDIAGAQGRLFRTKTDEITVDAEALTVLAKALQAPPEKWHGLTDVEQRYRQRYRDLIANADVREVFLLRSRVVSAIRRFLDSRGFIEVETPILIDNYGGAAARPFVTHHNTLDRDLYLRVATELYLKRLIVGGYDKVYEIGRIFRNEGLSTRHNPEFTMLESYEAYADYNDVMAMLEEMIASVAVDATGSVKVAWEHGNASEEVDFSPPWRRLTMRQALIDYAGMDPEQHRGVESLQIRMREMSLEPEPGAGWGKLLDQVVSAFVEPKLIQPTFLLDYPVELSPLAKRKPDNSAYVERFEPFAGGFEFGNAYTELNDPLEQRQRLLEQARLRAAGDEEAEIADEDFVVALEHGMPPTGGLGVGIDRLVMLLSGRRSIREVILFPTLRERR
jgi:lysyl-tRNA synthetase class 2